MTPDPLRLPTRSGTIAKVFGAEAAARALTALRMFHVRGTGVFSACDYSDGNPVTLKTPDPGFFHRRTRCKAFHRHRAMLVLGRAFSRSSNPLSVTCVPPRNSE